jgi:hypothetical protein
MDDKTNPDKKAGDEQGAIDHGRRGINEKMGHKNNMAESAGMINKTFKNCRYTGGADRGFFVAIESSRFETE